MVARPREHVLLQQGRIRELHEEDLGRIAPLHPGHGVPAGKDVEAVQAGPDPGVVRELHDPVRAAPVIDVRAPRERLVGQVDPALVGDVARGPQLLGDRLIVVQHTGGHVRAHEQHRGPEPVHEFALGAQSAQGVRERLRGHLHPVTERLVHVQGEPQVRGELPQLFG